MVVRLSDEARRLVALFEDQTQATVKDCVIEAEHDRIVYVIKAGDMAAAIGSGGETVREVEADLDRDVKLVEHAADAERFVANAFAPAAVYNVTISENDDTVAYVEVAQEDRGTAIGADGRNIDLARTLADRHFDIDDVELT
jgi:N utilization substance protein A